MNKKLSFEIELTRDEIRELYRENEATKFSIKIGMKIENINHVIANKVMDAIKDKIKGES